MSEFEFHSQATDVLLNMDWKRSGLTGYASFDDPHLSSYPKGAREDVYRGTDQKMFDFVYERNRESLDNLAIEYFGVKYTYRDMFEKIEQLAKAFKGYGIGKGDFVSLCLPNIPEIIYIKYALSRIGAVANLIDPRTNPKGIMERVNLADSKLLVSVLDICSEKIDPFIKELRVENIIPILPSSALPKECRKQTLQTLPVNVLYGLKNAAFEKQERQKHHHQYLSFSEFLRLSDRYEGTVDIPYEPDMPVTVLYTSGTSAESMNGGVFTNESYNRMVKNMKYGSPYILPGKTFLGAIPFFSAYGSFCGFHHSFANQWKVVMIPKFNPHQYDKLIVENKANAALGVPKFWELFKESSVAQKQGLEFLEIPVTGGDWMALSSIKEVNEAFTRNHAKVPLKIGYGATEFGGVVSTTSDDPKRYNIKSVGILLPGNKAMIIDPETGEELPYGMAGELCVAGPTMMEYYLKQPEKTEKLVVYKNGVKYYRTGDKMKMNEYGDLFYIDRYKRVMMRPDGHTVASTPIEDVIRTHPDVANCACVGLKIAADESGVIPTVFVELKDKTVNFGKIVKELEELSLENLGERERALVYAFIKKIPYTPNGKVDFRLLEKETFDTIEPFIVDSTFFDKSVTKKQKVLETFKNYVKK